MKEVDSRIHIADSNLSGIETYVISIAMLCLYFLFPFSEENPVGERKLVDVFLFAFLGGMGDIY